MKKLFLLALSLALTFAICACADNVADTTNTDANAIETEGTAEPNVVELNIGETVTTDIVEFSLTRFEFADKLKNATF